MNIILNQQRNPNGGYTLFPTPALPESGSEGLISALVFKAPLLVSAAKLQKIMLYCSIIHNKILENQIEVLFYNYLGGCRAIRYSPRHKK